MFDNKVMVSCDGLLLPRYGLVYLLIGLEQEGLGVAGDVAVCVAVSNLHIELGARAVEIVVGLGSGNVPVRVRVSVLLVELGVGSIEIVGIHGRSSLEVRGMADGEIPYKGCRT